MNDYIKRPIDRYEYDEELGLAREHIETYQWIHNYIAYYRISPTVREIAKGRLYPSHFPIQVHLDKLEEMGYITRGGRKWRNIQLTNKRLE